MSTMCYQAIRTLFFIQNFRTVGILPNGSALILYKWPFRANDV